MTRGHSRERCELGTLGGTSRALSWCVAAPRPASAGRGSRSLARIIELFKSALSRHRGLLIASLVTAALVVAGFGFIAAQEGGNGAPSRDGAGSASVDTSGIETNDDVEGQQLPDLELANAEGGSVRFADLQGTPLVVNFWYSTCAPCRQEIPAFAEVAASLAGSVRFVGINPLDSARTAADFAADRGMTYDNLLDPDGEVLNALGVAVFPTTLLVRSNGTIASQHAGAMTADQLRAAIDEHLLER